MKVHRSVLLSSIVVFVTRLYGISGETTAAASPKFEESSKSPNLSSFETSSENGVSVRSKLSIEKSLNSSDKGMDENNLVKKSVKNSTLNVDVESRGLFNDKQDLKFNKNGKRLMSSVSGDLSGSSTKKIKNEASEKDVRKQSSKSVGIDKDKKNFDGKKISTEIDNERRKHDRGKMQGSFVRPTLDGRDKNSVDILKRIGKPHTLNSPNLMTSLRSMFEIDEDNSDFKGIDKKMRSMMTKLKNLSKEHRETLIPYFDRFLSGILEKLESRDDEDIEQVEDLLERCTANRCCNNCCSCEKQRRNKKIKVSPQMVSNTRRKALRYDDENDASLEKAKKEIKISSMSSAAPTASTGRKTTSIKATKTTIEITTKSPKKTTMTMTTEIPEPYKKMRFEMLEKLRNRRRKRPVVSRRRLEDNNVGRKKLCVRRKSVGEQHRKSDPERGSRPNRRSNFDQDTSDTENIVRKKLRPNHRSNFDEDSSDSEMMPRKKLRSNHRNNFDDDTSDSEMIPRKKLRPKHRSNFDQDTDDSVIVTRRKSNFNRGSPNSLEDIQSIL